MLIFLQSLSRIYNITNDGESNLQSDLPSPVKMAQLCLVFTSLGAWVLVLSEFMTFTHDISLTECVWAKCGPRFGQSMDIRRILCSCHDCMCIIGDFK